MSEEESKTLSKINESVYELSYVKFNLENKTYYITMPTDVINDIKNSEDSLKETLDGSLEMSKEITKSLGKGYSINFVNDSNLNQTVMKFKDGELVENIIETNAENKDSGFETREQKNAVTKAEEYLSFTAFSYNELIDQLVYDKFSEEDAKYGVDNITVDWNEQALKKANDYLDFTAISDG